MNTAILPPLTERPAWKALETHYQQLREVHLRQLFADDPQRGKHLSAEAVGLYLDYSKNRITRETLNLLLQLAEESGLRARIDAMFRGEMLNVTEKRAVLHVALRAPKGASHKPSLLLEILLGGKIEGLSFWPNPLKSLAGDGRLERPTFGSGDQRSIHLS
jgi:hypothetical protein